MLWIADGSLYGSISTFLYNCLQILETCHSKERFGSYIALLNVCVYSMKNPCMFLWVDAYYYPINCQGSSHLLDNELFPMDLTHFMFVKLPLFLQYEDFTCVKVAAHLVCLCYTMISNVLSDLCRVDPKIPGFT